MTIFLFSYIFEIDIKKQNVKMTQYNYILCRVFWYILPDLSEG